MKGRETQDKKIVYEACRLIRLYIPGIFQTSVENDFRFLRGKLQLPYLLHNKDRKGEGWIVPNFRTKSFALMKIKLLKCI